MTIAPLPARACEDCGAPMASAPTQVPVPRPGLPPPRRCPACRDRWLAARNARLAAAYASGAPSPVRSFAPGPDAGPLHPAVCAACLRDIRLPFPPDPDRPAYCRPCLAATQGR